MVRKRSKALGNSLGYPNSDIRSQKNAKLDVPLWKTGRYKINNLGILFTLEKISHFLEMDPDARNNAKSSLQGMRCPANTHKPSFHVNTSVTSKHNGSKGTSSGQKGGMPTPNMEENMTEEEFFEWLQNAVQAGMFDTCGGSTSAESPSAKAGNFSKSGGTNSGSGSGSKRKKKGKKQW